MKNKIFALAAFLFTVTFAFAQNVGINSTGSSPHNSAMLDVDANNKGLLIPRVALTSATDATTISFPATSLLVYNTGTGGLTPAGYYYWDGNKWVRLLVTGTPSDAWLTTGNSGTSPSSNFIGTIDNTSLVFRTNNTEQMRITSAGNVGIGTTAPNERLHVANGNVRIGEINPTNTGTIPGYGRFLYFSGGPSSSTWDSDNSDPLWIARYNAGADATELRVNIGDNPNHSIDAFVVGSTFGSWNPVLRVQANGNVGIGTTTPGSMINSNALYFRPDPSGIHLDLFKSSNEAVINLRSNQDASGAKIGGIYFTRDGGQNDAHLQIAAIQARQSGTGTLAGGDLWFFVKNTGGGNGENDAKMVIKSGGNVGIGTTTPGGQFELSLDQGRKPSTNTWTITSDERLKDIHGPYTKGLNEILKLNAITYNYKNVGERTFDPEVLKTTGIGFSAQEVQKVFPEAVGVDPDGYLNFNMHAILVAYLNAIKEQQAIIESQKNEIERLKKKSTEVDNLKAEIEFIKSQLNVDKQSSNR
jgi:hypothetical protein